MNNVKKQVLLEIFNKKMFEDGLIDEETRDKILSQILIKTK